MSYERLTPDNLAQRWHKTTRYLAQLRCNGKGPVYIKIGRQILYRLQDIEEFEEKNLRRHTSEDYLLANSQLSELRGKNGITVTN